jgi:hypothetical protein
MTNQISIVSSMGGTGSTSFIHWFSRRIPVNCFLNSEGLRKRGPGANPKGLKHRMTPPSQSDPHLPNENAIKNIVFITDTPYNIIPSLFRRKIAAGHAKAISGHRPEHENNLESFLEHGIDSFCFSDQFYNWTNHENKREYKRLIIRFPYLWKYLDQIIDFLEISRLELDKFPPKKERNSSFNSLSEEQKEKFKSIYSVLDEEINNTPNLIII